MGVKGIFPLLKKLAPSAAQTHSLTYLRGKRVCIDGNSLLYRDFMSPLWLPYNQPSKHAIWCLRLARLCKASGIKPVVVFDSANSTPAKARERAKRGLAKTAVKKGLGLAQEREERLKALAITFDKLETLTPALREEVVRTVKHSQSDTSAEQVDRLAALASLPSARADVNATEAIVLSDGLREAASVAHALTEHLRGSFNSSASDTEKQAELSLFEALYQDDVNSPSEELHHLVSESSNLVQKLARRVAGPTQKEIMECQAILKGFQIPVQASPDSFEGECTAALLAKLGHVDLVASEDSDVLIYGSSQIRGFMRLSRDGYDSSADQPRFKLSSVTIVDLDAVLSSLSLSPAELVEFAILAGTDFTLNIRGMGPGKAYDLIRSHSSIEEVLLAIKSIKLASGPRRGLEKYAVHESMLDDATVARAIYTTFPEESVLDSQVPQQNVLSPQMIGWESLCRDQSSWRTAEASLFERYPDLNESRTAELLADPNVHTPAVESSGLVGMYTI